MERKGLIFLGLVLTLALVPGFYDDSSAPKWAICAIVLPLMLRLGRIRVNLALGLGFLVLIYASASLLWSQAPLDGYGALAKLVILAMAFALGTIIEDFSPLFMGLCIGVSVNGVLALAQTHGFALIPQMVPPAGLLVNKNVLAEIAAVAAIGAPLPILTLGPLLALALTHSRGAILAFLIGLMALVWPRSKPLACVIALALALAIDLVLGSGLGQPSILARVAIWHDTWAGLTWWGQGIGSFYTMLPVHASLTDGLRVYEEHAHNEWLEFTFELGLGAIPLAGLWTLGLMGRSSRLVSILVVVAIESLFSFPLHLPSTAVVAALLLGRLTNSGLHIRWWGHDWAI